MHEPAADGDEGTLVTDVMRPATAGRAGCCGPPWSRSGAEPMADQEWFEKDYYKVLGVSEDADQKAITKAYRKLAREHHPDAKPGDTAAEERFKEVSAAYDVVGDAGQAQGVRRGPPAGPDGRHVRRGCRCARRRLRRPGGYTFTTEDFGGGLGDILGGLFGRGGRRGARREPRHRPPAGSRPRGRAAPVLHGRGRGHHHHDPPHLRRHLLDLPRQRRRARAPRRSCARSAPAGASSTTTRACSRSARRARGCARPRDDRRGPVPDLPGLRRRAAARARSRSASPPGSPTASASG